MKILGILPYKGLMKTVAEVLEQEPDISADLFVGDMYEGLKIFKEHYQDDAYDFVISRGRTAGLIEEATHIPVVYIDISGYDMVRLIRLLQTYTGKTAVVGFSAIIKSIYVLCDLLQYEIDCFEINSENELFPMLSSLQSQGYNFVAGDVITAKAADSIGLNHAMITSGRESVSKALEQAKKMYGQLSYLREERNFYKKLIANEAVRIDVFDEEGNIFFTNDHAEMFDGIKAHSDIQRYKDQIDLKGHVVFNLTMGDELWHVEGSLIEGKEKRYLLYGKRYLSQRLKEKNIIKLDNDFGRNTMILSRFESSNAMMKRAIQTAQANCENYKPILIYGEQGTGREDFALSVHREKQQKNKEFIQVNCMALNCSESDEVFDTLFSLIDNKKSKIIFFNDIDHLNLSTQLLLLSFLHQAASIKRLKLLASSEISLEEMIQKGILHSEMYTFFSGIQIFLPPLRNRKEDIRNLSSLFITQFNSEYGKEIVGFQEEAYSLLETLPWHFNIKELRNLVKELVLESNTLYISKDRLGYLLKNQNRYPAEKEKKDTGLNLDQPLEDIERDIITILLKRENHNQSKVAKRLGISRSTLWRKLKNDL